jgi:uncharacterized membrane protein
LAENLYNPLPVSAQMGGGDLPPMEPRPWAVGEVLEEAWGKLQQNAANMLIGMMVFFFVSTFVNMIISLPLSIVSGIIQAMVANKSDGPYLGILVTMPISLVSGLLQSIVTGAMMVPLYRLFLASARGEPSDLNIAVGGFDRILPSILTQFLVTFAVFFGMIFFIVPGIILALGLSQAQIYAVDTRLGPVDCLKASWQAMDGWKMQQFILGLAVAGLSLVGMIPCGMGLFVVVPLSFTAIAIVFTRVSGRSQSGMMDPQVA